MLSSARIYIFKVIYQNSNWLSIKQSNQLAGLMAQMLSTGVKELTFKNIQFINVFEAEKYGTQIHINKITYNKQRVLSKEQIAELRMKVRAQLKKILQFKFEDVLIINDEFEFKSTSGYVGGPSNG
jgi:hypothetical protein